MTETQIHQMTLDQLNCYLAEHLFGWSDIKLKTPHYGYEEMITDKTSGAH